MPEKENSVERQITFLNPDWIDCASREPLVSKEWLEDHELRPEVAMHGDPAEIRELTNSGVKPRDIIILRFGR